MTTATATKVSTEAQEQQAIDALHAKLAPTPYADSRIRFTEAFKTLRKLGYIARANYLCCGSCATYGIAETAKKRYPGVDLDNAPDYANRWVTWNHQADASAFDGRDLVDTLYLGWGGDKELICAVLQAAGLRAVVPADKTVRILVEPHAGHDHVFRPEPQPEADPDSLVKRLLLDPACTVCGLTRRGSSHHPAFKGVWH